MTISISNTALSTLASRIEKTRYFSIELYCTNMIPGVAYDFYVDGIKMNDFVKPYGKNLGDPIVAQPDGKVILQYHMAVPFNQKYLTSKFNENGYMKQSKLLELRDPKGGSSITYLPMGVQTA